jgi:nucleotide-binding universal stress UspA family protein
METIVVATDFSAAADNAANYAAELAKYFSAKLVLTNAYPFPPANYEMGFSVPVISAIKDSAEERLENLKRELCNRHNWNFEIECVAEMGAPYEVIETVAKDQNADLIVMGIIGAAGGFKENIMGSTALKVVRSIAIPTFIIPEKAEYKRIRKISFACDLDKTEETDLVYVAKYFSKVFDAELEIVHVERPEEEMSFEKAKTSVFLEKKLEDVKHKTVAVTGRDVGHELEEYFGWHHTDVVMLSPKKHDLFHNLFRSSITKDLVFHMKVPLLAIH